MKKGFRKLLTFLLVFSMIAGMGVSFALDKTYSVFKAADLSGTSTNNQAKAGEAWYDSTGNLFIAVAANFEVTSLILTKGSTIIEGTLDGIFDNINIGKGLLDPGSYLSGATKKAMWYVFKFDEKLLKDGTYNITDSAVVGGGHELSGQTVIVRDPVPDYYIIYEANGGTGTMTDSGPYLAGEEATVKNNGFTWTDHSFLGWNTQADGEGTPYAEGAKFSMPANNITLYAQWEEDEVPPPPNPERYTVTFIDHDGEVLKTQRVNRGNDATPPGNPTRAGWEFREWDGNWTNVRRDETVVARYNELEVEVIEEPVPEAPPVVVPPIVEVPAEPTPQATPTLPKTGTFGAGEAAGIGALLMAIGLLLKRKKDA